MKRLAVKESGKTVTWKMSRPGKDAMTGSSAYAAGDSYTGVSTMTTSHGGQAMTVTRKYSARRLGDRR